MDEACSWSLTAIEMGMDVAATTDLDLFSCRGACQAEPSDHEVQIHLPRFKA